MNRKVMILMVYLCIILGMLISLTGAVMASGMLRAAFAFPTYIDPAIGSDTSSQVALVNLYDTLVFPDTKGTPLPHVAESWEVSSDGLTWTFYLRSGIKFHDGSELTAEDVKFSMDRTLTIGEGNAYLFMGKIKETVVVDKYTVAFHMERPYGPFLSTLFLFYIVNKDKVMTNIVNSGLYGDLGDYGKEYLLTHDAGSGSYTVKEFPLEEYLLMKRNPNYWIDFDSNAPDEFLMIATTTPMTLKTMMARREIEFCDIWQSAEALGALSKIEGIKIASFPAGSEYYLQMHTKKPPTDDIHFRKAMAWAFDYETATKLFLGSIQAKGPNVSSLAGSDPDIFQYHQDINKAIEELKQSKYYNHLDEYTLDLDWCSEVPDQEKIALLFMTNMDKIGINIRLVKTPWLSMVEESATPETSPNLFNLINTARYPEAISQIESRYHSSSAKTFLQNEWLLDPVLDEMIEDAIATIDKEERFKKYHKIQKYIVDLCPSIFILDPQNNVAYQSEYVDWYCARGENIPVNGYHIVARFIKVFPEKREKLLK